ncbi:FAD-dependent oxidoreductase [Streptomyces capoamus]|uniref:FAD-dependent oxidoreductase n=1 Tax=Streptomyces capoamus TaxID=68183 RepID=A0A919EY61_9ACTN|nr:NAD(P)/FAD-dependent oxidoreductase [Streptomyces capoamus]GGW20683.1 FAD-dependent oxidoreductase [Streptomyces libani subsp. rufus]GHG57669.1 FAD-dependent oxidoreductase [Streptomyces capoamus]
MPEENVPPAPAERRALIAGCGITGPVLALFLIRCGYTPVLYEARPEPDDHAGSFLNLGPNGRSVLQTLGIADTVLAHGAATTRLVFANHKGRTIGSNPEHTTCVKRGLLNRALRECAEQAGVRVEFGKRLADVKTGRPGEVTAVFTDGDTADGHLLVGADGINSATRAAVFPDAPAPSFTQGIGSGGFARTHAVGEPDGTFRMLFGLRGFFGYQVLPGGEVYWFENHTVPREPALGWAASITDDQWREQLVRRHAGDHRVVAGILRATEGPVGRWPLYDLPSIPAWHRGDVALVGDAAHAISPHLGQGAALGMEDAVVLAACLRDLPDTRSAFAAYEALRRPRVEGLIRQARRTGGQMTPAGPVGRALRDLMLPLFLRLGLKNAETVYGYRFDWSAPVTAAGR